MSQALPILYSFRRCPYAMRARMALDAAEIHVQHREVLLRDKPQAMLDASPKGSVPVLVLSHGRVIDESLDIMSYALSLADPQGWAIAAQADRDDAEAFLTPFKADLDRYKYASRYDPKAKRGTVNLDHRAAAMSRLIEFSEPLKTSEFLRGSTPRLIDVAIFPFIRQFAAVEPAWWTEAAPKGLQRFLAHWLSDERFLRIMVKHPVWTPDR